MILCIKNYISVKTKHRWLYLGKIVINVLSIVNRVVVKSVVNVNGVVGFWAEQKPHYRVVVKVLIEGAVNSVIDFSIVRKSTLLTVEKNYILQTKNKIILIFNLKDQLLFALYISDVCLRCISGVKMGESFDKKLLKMHQLIAYLFFYHLLLQ